MGAVLLLVWLAAHLGGCRPVLCYPWLGYLVLCFYKVGIISGCCLSPVPSCRKKKKSKSTIIFFFFYDHCASIEICLQRFKRSFGFQCILVSLRWKRAKSRQAGLAVLDHSFGAGGQGRSVMGGVCRWSSWCLLIMPVVSFQSAVRKQKCKDFEPLLKSCWPVPSICGSLC